MKIFKMLGRERPLSGSVGIEIEVEGENLKPINDGLWRTDHDGSLKADEAYEYVLCKPVPYAQVNKSIDKLEERLKGSKIYDSERAGVHVHINMQHDTVPSLGSFLCTYYLFETALLNFCGNKRAGNLFCLRLRDADKPIDHILIALECLDLGVFLSDDLRYASLNLKALPQYGSVEFRGMRSTSDFRQIKLWISLLLSIRRFARSIESPSDIPDIVEQMGPIGFAEHVFGTKSVHLTDQSNFVKHFNQDALRITELLYTKKWGNTLEHKQPSFEPKAVELVRGFAPPNGIDDLVFADEF